MAVDNVRDRYNGLLLTIGKQTLNLLFPNDFEYYLMGFELTDSAGNLVDYLALPVLPDSFSEEKIEITNVTKTAGGISSVISNSFIPRTISIRGTFGRKFRFMFGGDSIDVLGLRFSTNLGIFNKQDLDKSKPRFIPVPFNAQIKTGYGLTKILEAIIDKSTALDAFNKPFNLYFYNLFGNSYLLEPSSLKLSRDVNQSSTFSYYDVTAKAIAPINSSGGIFRTSLIRQFSFESVNKEINNLRSSFNIQVI